MNDVAADRVENEFDAAPAGDLARAHLEILGAIVDQMIDAERAQFAVLGRRGGADDGRADMLGDLGRGDADAAAGGMNQHGLAAFEAAHDDDELPGGEIVDRDRRGGLRRHAGRPHEDLAGRGADHIGIAAEPRHRQDVAPDQGAVDARSDRIDAARDLVARNHRQRRQVRIETETAQNIGEIDAARFDADAHLALTRNGIGRLLDGEHLGRAVW